MWGLYARRYASAGLCDRNVSVWVFVCLSVHLSVTSRYYIKTKKAGVMISSPSGSITILVFWCQISSPNSKGFPQTRGVKRELGGKIQRFSSFKRQNCVNISKTIADTARVTVGEWLIESRMWAFDWQQDRWPWMTLNCGKVKFCRNFAWIPDFGRQQRLNKWMSSTEL